MIAKDLYLLRREVEKLEKEVKNASLEKQEKLKDTLRKKEPNWTGCSGCWTGPKSRHHTENPANLRRKPYSVHLVLRLYLLLIHWIWRFIELGPSLLSQHSHRSKAPCFTLTPIGIKQICPAARAEAGNLNVFGPNPCAFKLPGTQRP